MSVTKLREQRTTENYPSQGRYFRIFFPLSMDISRYRATAQIYTSLLQRMFDFTFYALCTVCIFSVLYTGTYNVNEINTQPL